MPRFDGTGPMGQGAMTGGGFGMCGRGRGAVRGFGMGAGRGAGMRGFGRRYFNQSDELDYLKQEKEMIEQEIARLERAKSGDK